MSLFSIIGILLALGLAVWIACKLCYWVGYDAGYEKRRTEEWVKKVRKYVERGCEKKRRFLLTN